MSIHEFNAKYLYGRPVAEALDAVTATQVNCLVARDIQPHLAIVHAGQNQDDLSYQREAEKQAAAMGLVISKHQLAAQPTPEELADLLHELNHDNSVHAVLVQTMRDPALRAVIRSVLSNHKDPEGVTARHMGELMLSDRSLPPTVAPCTAVAIQTLIKSKLPDLRGKLVVIINSSPVIGKPLNVLLASDGATPVMCHSDTGEELKTRLTLMADVIVVATGRRGIIGPQHIKPGAMVIDAAINRVDGRVVGDLDTDSLLDLVSWITPVPCGVGPVTTATLLANSVKLAKLHHPRCRLSTSQHAPCKVAA
jgi:methylenetetrahydrofolate dehydrogenase (NADP+)/methenyltetrahydrofolate cyclohydrolase